MKILNFTNAPIRDSQFDEVRINAYNQRRIAACLHAINIEHDHGRRFPLIARLVEAAQGIDRNNCGKIAISGFLPEQVRKEIAKAMVNFGFDTYSTQITGEDITWIDPR